jgi:hypothetical protein
MPMRQLKQCPKKYNRNMRLPPIIISEIWNSEQNVSQDNSMYKLEQKGSCKTLSCKEKQTLLEFCMIIFAISTVLVLYKILR